MKQINQDAKTQVEKIVKSAQTNERWKHEKKKVVISDRAKEKMNELFSTLEAIFPAWRVSMKSERAISNVKLLWTEEFIQHKIDTGENLNIEQGIRLAKASESDFFPSIGKFISWCKQDGGLTGENEALERFNNAQDPMTYIEKVTRSRCGYKAKRMNQEKGDRLFLKTFREVKRSTNIQDRNLLLDKSKEQKTIYTRKENQNEINQSGVDGLKKLF